MYARTNDATSGVRPARPDDARAIAEIHVAAWREAYRGIVAEDYLAALSVPQRELIWRQAIEKGVPEVWVALADAAVAGYIAFGHCRDSDRASDTGEIWAIYVGPQYWSRAVGRALWRAARARLQTRGFKEVTLWVLKDNVRALRFYRATGFFPNERTIRKIRVGATTLDEIRYETILALQHYPEKTED